MRGCGGGVEEGSGALDGGGGFLRMPLGCGWGWEAAIIGRGWFVSLRGCGFVVMFGGGGLVVWWFDIAHATRRVRDFSMDAGDDLSGRNPCSGFGNAKHRRAASGWLVAARLTPPRGIWGGVAHPTLHSTQAAPGISRRG